MYKKYTKRILDCFIASTAIVFLSPVFIIVMMALFIENGPYGIFFLQNRPGKKGKIFRIIKYKTMTDERAADGRLLSDQDRLTKLGRFLRATSLDELPQLFNIIKGDMSLIGPRPLAVIYLKYYDDVEMRRHDVRPGITGLAQVKGRKSIDWGEKMRLDIEYVNNVSFRLDAKIFFKTICKVVKRQNVGIETSGKISFHEWKMRQNKDGNR